MISMIMTPMIMIPMISFLAAWRLWFLLLIPALVILYLALTRHQQRRAGRSGPSDLQFLLPRQRPWLRHVAVFFAVMSLLTLTVAWARPKQTIEVPRERATILVTIDVSKSMEAHDIDPSRIEAAKSAAINFVNGLPAKFNVALISFAGTADIEVNPTTDHGAVTAAIGNLGLRPSTAIGEGIFTSLGALAAVPPDPSDPKAKVPARMVLMSDGSTQAGRSSQSAAEEAKKDDVPIYSIAYGTPDGFIISGGQKEPVPVDYSELARIAKITGGKAYKAESASQLRNVYADIGTSVGKEKIDSEVTVRYAGIGLLFAVLAALGVASLASRWP